MKRWLISVVGVVGAVAVVGIGWFGLDWFALKSDNPQNPDDSLVKMQPPVESSDAQPATFAGQLEQMETALAQVKQAEEALDKLSSSIPDRESFSSRYREITAKIQSPTPAETRLDPASNPRNPGAIPPRQIPPRQTEQWQLVMENYADATGVPTQSLESLFVNKSTSSQ